MSEELLIRYVQQALDALERGEDMDLRDLCAAHPELVAEVAEVIGLRGSVVATHRAASEVDPRIGLRLADRYTIRAPIGRGAMGIVYAADDDELGRSVAIKMFWEGQNRDPEDEARFVREARALAQLDHAHVVRVFDRGRTDDGGLFLVMEHLRGLSLSAVLLACGEAHAADSERIPTFGPWSDAIWPESMPVPRGSYLHAVASWLADVASGLASAHAQGVFHRDVKPSNIFLREATEATTGTLARVEAVLIDFGIAAKAGDAALTASHATLGTPWYMPPEQVHTAGEAAGPTLDVYALCATLYHLVALVPPYDGTAAAVVARVQHEDPRPVRALRPELPRDLVAIVEHGMERDPRRRYSTVAGLEADLRAFLDHRPVSVRPLSAAGRALRRARRRPVRAFAVLVCVLLLPTALWAWSLAAAASERRDASEVRRLVAGLPRLLGVAGEPGERQHLDPSSRERAITRLTRIVELQPGDTAFLSYLAVLLVDAGANARAAAAWRQLQASAQPALIAWGRGDQPRPEQLDLQSNYERWLAALLVLRDRQSGFAALACDLLDRVRPANGSAAEPSASIFLHARELELIALAQRAASTRDLSLWQRAATQARAIEQARGGPTARTLATRGIVNAAQLRTEDAIALLEQADRLCPGQYGVLKSLADMHRRRSEFADAIRYLELAIHAQPRNWRTFHSLATLEKKRGAFAKARTILDEIPDGDAPAVRWHLELVRAEIAQREAFLELNANRITTAQERARTALAHFDRALSTAPEQRHGQIHSRRELADGFATGDWNRVFRSALASAGRDSAEAEVAGDLAYLSMRAELPAWLESELELYLRYLAYQLSSDPEFRQTQAGRIRELQRQD